MYKEKNLEDANKEKNLEDSKKKMLDKIIKENKDKTFEEREAKGGNILGTIQIDKLPDYYYHDAVTAGLR